MPLVLLKVHRARYIIKDALCQMALLVELFQGSTWTVDCHRMGYHTGFSEKLSYTGTRSGHEEVMHALVLLKVHRARYTIKDALCQMALPVELF